MSTHEIDNILLQAEDSRHAISAIFNHFRSMKNPYSLGLLAKTTKIPSRGYLGDVMSGRNVIGPTYRERLFRAFELTAFQASVLRTLVAIDSEADQEYREHLQKKLAAQKSRLARHEPFDLSELEAACKSLWARPHSDPDVTKVLDQVLGLMPLIKFEYS